MNVFRELFVIFSVVHLSCSNVDPSFAYEKMHTFGLGRKVIEDYRRVAKRQQHFFFDQGVPAALPSVSSTPYIRSPWKNVYQGRRRIGDKRVYNQRFDHAPQAIGHRVLCQGFFNCIITHMAIETEDAVPIIARGGAGYRYFMVVTKAQPGTQLKGRVRAYCRQDPEPRSL